MQKLTLLLFFCTLLLGANAQNWEEVRFEDFENGISGLEDFVNNGFSSYSRYGATGGTSDASIRTNLNAGRYVAFEVELSDSYEYRFSWNLKSVLTYTWIDLSLNVDLDEDLVVFLDNERISSTAASAPGNDYSSGAFTGYNGTYYLKLENRRSSGGTTRRLYADNFRLERRLIAVIPPVSVSSSSLTVNEGASTQVCFDVAEAPTSDLSFDLVLTGNASPHFDDYATQNVLFPAGSSSTQCLTIATDALDEVQSPNTSYSFQIQNMLNGELPSNTTVSVEVLDQSPAPPPAINFVNQTLNLDEGSGVEVCLSISTAPEQAVSMEVALLGNASPHFDDYTSITLNFPTGSTNNQCFILNTDPLDQELSGDLSYSFVLQTPVGSEIGSADQLTVNVNDQSVQALPSIGFVTTTSSIIAGEDLQVCLSTSEAPSELAAVEVAIAGNNTPHFTSFTTTTVQFPIGETGNQCFNLSSLVAAEVTESTDYTFILQNPVSADLGSAVNLILTVNPPATDPDCPYAGPDQIICAGETITIGCPDDPENPSPYCFKWEPEVGFVEDFGPTQPNPTIQPEETTTYTLYVTDGNGNLIAEEETTVTVQSLPGVTIYPAEATLCQGESIDLEAITWDDVSQFDISWSNGAVTPEITVSTPGTYTVTLSNDNTGCQQTAEVNVISSLETVSIVTSTNEVCTENPVTLTANPITPNPASFVFEWSTGATGTQIEVTEPGEYSLTLTNTETGCATSDLVEIQSQEIEVHIQPENPVVCEGSNRTVTLAVEEEYSTIEWSNHSQDPTQVIGTSDELIVSSVGTYGVTVTASDGCKASDVVEVKDAMADPSVIKTFFEDKGFYSFDIRINGPITLRNAPLEKSLTNTLCDEADPCVGNSDACVQDVAQLQIDVKRGQLGYEPLTNLEGAVQANLDAFQDEFGYQNSRAYITSNDQICVCDDYLSKVETKFSQEGLKYWIHLYDAPEGEEDQFYILTNVPSTEVHHPIPGPIYDFVDEGVSILQTDTYSGDFPEAMVATVMDRTLDNHIIQRPSNDNQSYSHLICENTVAAAGSDVYCLSPACGLLLLPEGASLRYELTGDWPGIVPEGALTGFSDFSVFQSSGEILYYYGRTIRPTTPDQKPAFAGYYRTTLSGQPTTDWTAYSNFPPISAPEEGDPLTITYGIPTVTDGILTAIEVEKYPYVGSNYPTSTSTGSGDMVLDFFSDPGCQVLGEKISSGVQHDIDLPSINVADVSSGQFNQFGYEGIFIKKEESDGSTTYIYAVEVEGQLRTFFWDCFTGSYQEFTVTDPAVIAALEARVVGKNNQYNPDNGTEPDPPGSIEELEEPTCFVLPPGKLQAYNQGSSSFDEQAGVYNYAGAQGEFLQDLQENIAQTAAGNVFLKFIVTADGQPNDEQSAGQPTPNERFESFGGGGDNTDMVFWIHFMEDGTAGLCVKFVNDFFIIENDEETISSSEALRLKEVFTTAIADAIAIKKEELFDTDPTNDQDDLSAGEPSTSTNGPWFFGLRENNTNPSFLNLLSEVSRIGGGLVKTFKIEEGTWKYTSTSLFQFPPALSGVCDGLLQENPVVGIVEACKFGLSFVKDEKTRNGIIQALKKPGKILRAIYDQKKQAYTGALGQDVMYHTAGADVVGVVTLLTGFQKLIEFLKQRKSPDGAADGLAESADEFPEPDDLDFDNLPEVYQQLKNHLDGDYSDEIKKILEFIGSEKSLKKFVDHPRLVKVYDKLRKDPAVSLNDYQDIFKKLDGADDAFFIDFLDNFVDASGSVSDKAKSFLDDIRGKDDLLDAFKKAEASVKAWDNIREAIGNTGGFTKFANDLPTLKAVTEMMADGSLFRSKVGVNWEQDLKAIIMTAKQGPCSICNSGRVGRTDMGEYLKDVDHFITNFEITPGAKGEVFFNWMRGTTNPGDGQLDELHQTLRDLAKREIVESMVEGLGKQFPNGSTKRYDLLRVDGKYTEYKNKDYVSKSLSSNPSDISQMIEGYLTNIINLNDLEWKAGIAKLKHKGWTDANALTNMKKQWKRVFSSRRNELFDAMWNNIELRQNTFGGFTETQAKTILNGWIDTMDDQLFKFIKVE